MINRLTRLTGRTARFARVMFAGAIAAVSAMTAGPVVASPGLVIIVYHQIRNTPDGPPDSLESISLAHFGAQMRYLHDQGYVTLSTAEAVNYVRGAKAPGEKLVAIHFDDGWKSAQLALPVLATYGFKATFWIIAGTGIGSPHMDWEDVAAISRDRRYEIYSHTMTHPWKPGDTMLDWINGRTPGKGIEQVRWELAESRRVLAEKLGGSVPYLAWPAGRYNDVLIRLAAEAGYSALFTIDNGVNHPGDDTSRLRRTMIHGSCNEQVFAQILQDGVYRECKQDD